MVYLKSECFSLLLLFGLCLYVNAEDYIYYPTVDKHYKFHRIKQTWFEARNVCRFEGATLAMPKDADEMNILAKYFNDNYPAISLADIVHKDYILLGFHDHFAENEYITLQGESLQYHFHKWGGGQPDNLGNEDCGSLHRGGVINDFPCLTPAVFMCEKPGKNVNQQQLTSCASNDPAYKCHEDLGVCYKLHWNPKTWAEARNICHLEGGKLAMIKNKKIEEFLVEIFNDPQNYVPYVEHKDYALIGFHDMYEEGKHVTVEDKPIYSYDYANWAPGQPDNAGGAENCGSMTRKGQINDFPCQVPAVFICERPSGIDTRFQPE